MAHTLEQFAAACHDILKADPGPTGRQKICAFLQDVLKDDDFIATHLGDNVPERKILYEDPELGFCILAHVYQGARETAPHDHGPSWAIYGQARGETEMTDWALVEPGMDYAYHEAQLHSPRRAGPTRLIRIEGLNMDKVRRLAYEPV